VTARPVFADATGPAERAARLFALRFVHRAVLDAGPEAAARAVARFEKGYRTPAKDGSWRVKHYRRAAKKAARLFR
jgi:hypothetical protein